MTTFLVFSITRGKEINMDTIKINDDIMKDDDPYEYCAQAITPPYLGESIVVKKDDTRSFKLRYSVVEK